MGHWTLVCATFAQPYHWERIFVSSEGLSWTFQLGLGPWNFYYLRGLSKVQQADWVFSLLSDLRSSHVKVFTLNRPKSGSRTGTQRQALAWQRWSRQACLNFHFPPRFLSTDQWTLHQIHKGRPIRQSWNPLDDTAPMRASLYRITLLNLDVVWLFYRKSSEERQRDQSKDTENLPGPVVFPYFAMQTEEEFIPTSASCKTVIVSMKLLWRRKCLLGAGSWCLPRPHKTQAGKSNWYSENKLVIQRQVTDSIMWVLVAGWITSIWIKSSMPSGTRIRNQSMNSTKDSICAVNEVLRT